MPPVETDTEGTGIAVMLDDLLSARGMTLTELAERVGLTLANLSILKTGKAKAIRAERVGLTLANLSILKTGKAKAIRFSTLAAICRELGCQPGDLLAYRS
jgi:putative transcriptional regulator